MLSAIEAVKHVIDLQKAKKRIDFETRPGVTFFSGQDIWLYDPREDNITCEDCRNYADMAASMGGFNGNMIRSLFPWLMILDENTIGGQGEGGDGLVHPNCRCRLIRYVGDPKESVSAQAALKPKENLKEKKE